VNRLSTRQCWRWNQSNRRNIRSANPIHRHLPFFSNSKPKLYNPKRIHFFSHRSKGEKLIDRRRGRRRRKRKLTKSFEICQRKLLIFSSPISFSL